MRRGAGRGRSRWPVRLVALLAGCAALALAPIPLGRGHAAGAAEVSTQELTPQTDAAIPAENVVMLGATPAEPGAPAGTTWGLGELAKAPKLVRYVPPPQSGGVAEEGGWEPGPELPAGFQPDHPNGSASPLEGQMTPEGYGVLAGTIAHEAHESEPPQILLVRKPGGAFEATAPVPTEGAVKTGEEALLTEQQTLFGRERAPMIAPLAESDGSAGALVVPVYRGIGVDKAVLHWDGHSWTQEPIEIPTESAAEFNVLAIGASSPQHAWLLARLSSAYGKEAVALFRRVEEKGSWSWQPVEAEVGQGTGQVGLALRVPVSGGVPAAGEPFSVFGAEGAQITVESQLLTVTDEGVWVDGVRTDVERQQPYTTMYLRQVGSKAVVEHSWCKATAETPDCQETLPEEPSLQYGRSIAWSGSPPYGERVITGLFEGVTLRLHGESFEPVLSFGGGEQPNAIPGRLYGAAFTSPNEGWLGYQIPVHLTASPEPDRLVQWPVATRHPLVALAPAPGAPVAALSSEALAVGESGGVVRYKPGQGWLPESLFGPGERVEKPNLRAVAWPTTNRAFAVGEGGEMWLWRGETGLWERDPATPINFRANLYGIAFDPTNPARGYAVGAEAVGQGGVILRYGKTWTQEKETELPAEVRKAQFTGIAFAGSEALVAYNVQRNPGEAAFNGGLLVNDGSGWTVEREEQQVSHSARVQAVAALPDGGAAVLAGEASVRLYERESAGAPWRQEATPLPTGVSGSLALYRHEGALRALLSAGGASGLGGGAEYEPSPGFPPYEQTSGGFGGGAGTYAGALLRQTVTGWSDERHSVDPTTEALAYGEYDEPYNPDPVIATLVAPGGSEAWVVGGIASGTENEQAADVERYPSGSQPPNEGTSRIPVTPEEAGPGGAGGVTTLAFGGNATCAAPCEARVETDPGPEAWLARAVSVARGAGASAFFYTGPMVKYSPYEGPVPPRPPFAEEYERYARLFANATAGPAYAANAQGELEGEAELVPAFEGLASPLGSSPASGWAPAGSEPSSAERESCGCADGYYALQNAHVEVIVLDDAAGGVEAAQRVWLEQRLQEAGTATPTPKPVIVVAEADLSKQLAPGKHEEDAERLFAALTGRDPDGDDPGGYAASAYFYDAPEENVSRTVSFDGSSLQTFGSGTLGYEHASNEDTTEFHGAKGVLFGEVEWGRRTPAEKALDRAPVAVRLVPVIGELSVESNHGTLLPRSETALFSGLARRPRGGCRGENDETSCDEGQYIPIPSICVGVRCSEAVLPEYEFRSSRPDIGGFVKINTASDNRESVLLNAKNEPVQDGREENGEQVGATSGLFCAYNKGETKVTINAGGLSYTLAVQVQAGSVRQPCGTVPLRELPPVSTQAAPPAPAPAPNPSPAATPPAAAPPPIVPPPPAVPAPPRPAVPAQPFVPLAGTVAPVLAFVPPPVPTPARPTPPTGTSAVTSPVEVAEREEEREEAPESVSNKAVAYRSDEHDPLPAYLLGMIVLAAFAGASARRRGRGGRGEVRVAHAVLSSAHAQRRLTRERRRPPW